MIRQARGLLLALLILQVLLLTTTLATRPPDPPIPLPILTDDAQLNLAERTALDVLAADQQGSAHRAAPYYQRPWIRDSYAWGMVPDNAGTLASYSSSELSYWLTRQQPFGGWVSFQYSGWYDETPILISAVLDAYRLTGDRAAALSALPALRRGWAWLRRTYIAPAHGSACLLWASLRPNGQSWATDWADQVARVGYTPQLEGLWYRATHAMAALELLDGWQAASRFYDAQASCIAADANRLLWRVNAPAHRDARPLRPFGHYSAWPPRTNYFEIDGNALLMAAGVATAAKRSDVLGMVAAHARYLLGGNGAGPARVLYGDYSPADYGPIHDQMGAGRYQSAYWPSVGGLLALAAARADQFAMSLTVLHGLAQRDASGVDAFHEWYSSAGTPSGAALYGWGARMYLLALYRAYLGVDDSPDTAHPADLVLRAAPGPARGALVRLGLHITIVGHGSGRFRYARLGKRILRSPVIPARLLYDGAVLEVYHGNA